MYVGFPSSLVPALRCARDGGNLRAGTAEEHIKEGELRCEKCQISYPIREGIALLVDETQLEPFLAREMHERDKQAANYDAHFADRYHREIKPTIRSVGDLSGKTVIEYGAGTGRFTMILSKQSDLYLATDLSLNSLQLLARRELPDTVGLACAEATALSTAPGFFDVALAFQLIEHMPQKAMRDRFYNSVMHTLKVGGRFVASVYHQNLRRIIKLQPKDGAHRNGIVYHFFSTPEFRKELTSHFRAVSAHPIDIVLPLEKRLRLSSVAEGGISRLLQYVPVLNLFGHLVLAKAQK